jgi:hypothetical protein
MATIALTFNHVISGDGREKVPRLLYCSDSHGFLCHEKFIAHIVLKDPPRHDKCSRRVFRADLPRQTRILRRLCWDNRNLLTPRRQSALRYDWSSRETSKRAPSIISFAQTFLQLARRDVISNPIKRERATRWGASTPKRLELTQLVHSTLLFNSLRAPSALEQNVFSPSSFRFRFSSRPNNVSTLGESERSNNESETLTCRLFRHIFMKLTSVGCHNCMFRAVR